MRCNTQSMRLDGAKIEELRRWGHALREGGSEESVAAGRAMLMLIEELERLRLELSRATEQVERLDTEHLDRVPKSEVMGTEDAAASALHRRLMRVLGRDSDQSTDPRPRSVEETGPSVELQSDTTSAQSWIETLRRQK
jgi:hypothetical protein